MSRFQAISLICLLGTLPFTLGQGCDLSMPLRGEDAGLTNVFILNVDMLTPPAVKQTNLYKPGFIFATDPSNPSAGESIGFTVTVATSRSQDLQVRLMDTQSKADITMIKVSPPTPTEWSAVNYQPQPFNQSVRDYLLSDKGVYWLADEAVDGNRLNHRLAVIIPESLCTPFMKLEIFVHINTDGTPIGSDRLEIVDDFFYLAVIGDSIMWGNGLKEKDKFTTLIAETIEAQTLKKVIEQVHAVSGAKIVPAQSDEICTVNCNGEVPKAVTSITTQAELIEHPELIDLILMDGCINDIQVSTILDPGTTKEELIELTDNFCNTEISNLLQKIRSLAPQAYIIVTGYFQIVSLDSELSGLEQWKTSQGVESNGDAATLVEVLTANSILFHENSITGLTAAVDSINDSETETPRIALVNPGFESANAVCTQDSWLWGLSKNEPQTNDLGTSLQLFPEDPLLEFRAKACFDQNVALDLIACLYASVGHPNVTGAKVYADAIINQLRIFGILPQ